jgi:hypothetical protein
VQIVAVCRKKPKPRLNGARSAQFKRGAKCATKERLN